MVDIIKPEKVAGTPKVEKVRRNVKVTPVSAPAVEPTIPPKVQEALEADAALPQDTGGQTIIPERAAAPNMDTTGFSIVYNPLCSDKIKEIPGILHYKPIDGFHVTKLNDLTLENIDEGMNTIMDNLCLESLQSGFTHWLMTVDEKIRSFLNLRLNSSGKVIEHLVGLCKECGEEKLFTKVIITDFEEDELKSEYREPFPLKAKVDNKIVKFKARMVRSGDIYRAKEIYAKDKGFIARMFPQATLSDESVVIQVLEYANSVLELHEAPTTFENSVEFCRDNLDVMNALTAFNDNFLYGMQLQAEEECDNEKCSSITMDEKTGKPIKRRCQFRFPIQPSLFYITYTEKENVEQYFDLREDGKSPPEVAPKSGS